MSRTTRTAGSVLVVSALAALLVAPASATPPVDGEHQVTICHVTESEGNPYVLITVDVAAFDGEGANDHSHHEAKDGRVDVVSVDGTCPGLEPTTTTTFGT